MSMPWPRGEVLHQSPAPEGEPHPSPVLEGDDLLLPPSPPEELELPPEGQLLPSPPKGSLLPHPAPPGDACEHQGGHLDGDQHAVGQRHRPAALLDIAAIIFDYLAADTGETPLSPVLSGGTLPTPVPQAVGMSMPWPRGEVLHQSPGPEGEPHPSPVLEGDDLLLPPSPPEELELPPEGQLLPSPPKGSLLPHPAPPGDACSSLPRDAYLSPLVVFQCCGCCWSVPR
ncbi:UNVERIFIED_CONTAM: hypothetical protein FKN15_067185 [Acipenser sinensis]